MKRALAILILMAMFVPAVLAQASEEVINNDGCDTKWFCNQEMALECQYFYGDSRYYTIAKWTYDGSNYALEEQNNLYRYYGTNVAGNLNGADWTSDPKIDSVLVKAGDETLEFNGGASGSVKSDKEISHVTFCGYRSSGKGASLTTTNTGSNGVPEFPAFTVGAAVLVATLGLVFLRKE